MPVRVKSILFVFSVIARFYRLLKRLVNTDPPVVIAVLIGLTPAGIYPGGYRIGGGIIVFGRVNR